jgi:hypothetical protein
VRGGAANVALPRLGPSIPRFWELINSVPVKEVFSKIAVLLSGFAKSAQLMLRRHHGLHPRLRRNVAAGA